MNVFSSLSRTPKTETTTSRFAAALVTGVLSTLPVVANASTSNHFSSAELFPDAAVETLSAQELHETHGEGIPVAFWLFGAYAGYDVYTMDPRSREAFGRVGLNIALNLTSPVSAVFLEEAQRGLDEAKRLAAQKEKDEQAKRDRQKATSRVSGYTTGGTGLTRNTSNDFAFLETTRYIGIVTSEDLPIGWGPLKTGSDSEISVEKKGKKASGLPPGK